jgi:hypothetical protein
MSLNAVHVAALGIIPVSSGARGRIGSSGARDEQRMRREEGTLLPGKYALFVSVGTTPEGKRKWYEEEHIGLVSKLPVFLREEGTCA